MSPWRNPHRQPTWLLAFGGWGGRSSGICQGAGLVLAGISKVHGLRLALLYFDGLGFDGSGACWFGLAHRGQGLREFAGHGPWSRLALTHGLAHVAHAFHLRSTKGSVRPRAHFRAQDTELNTDGVKPTQFLIIGIKKQHSLHSTL